MVVEIGKERSRIDAVPVMGFIVGAVTYLMIYGFELLDVSNVTWLFAKNDLTQHYNGWQFFRNSKWYFPIGMMDTVTYPHLYSVVYTDAIPLFALFFKLLSPILPETFQYFGLWGLFCYSLQGMIAACILQRCIDDKVLIIIGVIFFTFSPWMFHRLYMHSSLAAHWLLLLCILIILRNEELSLKRYTLEWCGIFLLASMIHVYFIPMCAIYLGCNTLYKMWKKRKYVKESVCILLAAFLPILTAAGVLWLLGAFSSSASYAVGGFGEASANLNFLFNSVGKSCIFPALPHPYTKWPEESFGYLGLGIFVLLAAAIVRVLIDRELRKLLWKNRSKAIFIGLFVFICIWLATSPAVVWNEEPLFRWLMPKWMEKVLEIFRSLGRFVWLICYLLMLAAIVGCGYKVKGKKRIAAMTLLGGCLLLQIWDFHKFYEDRVEESKKVYGYKELNPELWDGFIDDYEHIFCFDQEKWADFSTYAGSRDLTVNQTYLARANNQIIWRDMQIVQESLWAGQADEKTLYIFPLAWEMEKWEELPPIYIYRNGGYYVGSVKELVDLKDYDINLMR